MDNPSPSAAIPVDHHKETQKQNKADRASFDFSYLLHSSLLIFMFLKYWYFDAPLEILKYFFSLNKYLSQLLGFAVCLKTFFKPVKNEYRQGLVGFSIAFGIIIKSCIIIADTLILTIFILLEALIIISFLAFPVLTILLLFI